MIRAKCDWVYQVPYLKTGPRPFSASRAARSLFYVLFERESVQKKIRAAHVKEKQRI